MSALGDLQARWGSLAGRERRLVLGAGALIAAALVWWIALAPALATLRMASLQTPQLDAQLQQMLTLKVQALALRSQPTQGGEEARRALEALVRQRLAATAQMAVVGDRVTVTLKGTSADVLAQWLVQARTNARAVPIELRLVKSGLKGAASPSWDGTVVLRLPAR